MKAAKKKTILKPSIDALAPKGKTDKKPAKGDDFAKTLKRSKS